MRNPFRRRHAALDARVDAARENAEAAERQAELSEERYRSVRQHVVDPRRELGRRNGFADILRDSLAEGHGRRA